MDTVTGQHTDSDERILLDLETRSIEESDAITAQAQAGPQLPMRADDARRWAEADEDAISQLSDASRQAALDVIARNMLTSTAYAEQFNLVAPQHAMAAQPVAHAQQVAHVIATHLPLHPEMLLERSASWPAPVANYFRAPTRHHDVQQHVERMVSGINKESLNAFHTQAAMLAPATDGNRQHPVTSGLRIHTAWDLTYEEQVRQVGRVLSENASLVPWKVEANLRREPAAIRALLADPIQMRLLEHDVTAHVALPAERMAQVRAMIEQTGQHAPQSAPRPHDAIARPAMAEGTTSHDDALELVTNFIVSVQNLTKEAIRAEARHASPAMQAILGNSRQMQELDQALNARLAFLSAGRVADVQAVIATALGRNDAGQRELTAQALRVPTEAPPAPGQPSPETIQRTIDFLATATTLYDAKIHERLESTADDVKSLLANADRMKELDGAINARLAHILPERLAVAQAAIAVALNRPDAGQRMQAAQALRQERAPTSAPMPTSAPQAQPKSELEALQDRFRQRIESATAATDGQPGIQELHDRIVSRHLLYDNLAILTRMERGEQIIGEGGPRAQRGIVPSPLARQWAQRDAADLQAMLRAAGNRLEHVATLQAAMSLINGTSERDRAYQSNFSRAAPTLRADVEAARVHSETYAVAEFIRVNHTQPAWKIQSNLDRAAPALQRILRDSKRMGELDAAVQELLPHLEQHQRHAVQAVITGDLQRADLNKVPAPPLPAHAQPAAPPAEQSRAEVPATRTAVHQPAQKTGNDAPTSDTATVQSSRNGIAPASNVQADPAPVVKKLLEDMSYKARADGSVLYQVQGKDAFVDHGDQLLMVKGAEKEERAILGALLLAKEKYAGAFELTGSEAFKRAAIDVLVRYQVDVRLKNPEQDLMRREAGSRQTQTEFARATPEHPAAPVDLGALASRAATIPLPDIDSADVAESHPGPSGERQTSQPAPVEFMGASTPRQDEPVETVAQATHMSTTPAPANTNALDMGGPMDRSGEQRHGETAPVDRLSGTLLSHGAAPYQNSLRNDASYFVELKNSDGRVHTQWGQGLASALGAADARIGDEIALNRLETIDISKKVPKWDEHGNFLEQRAISGHRNHWEAQIVQRQPDSQAAALVDHEPEQAPPADQLTGTLLRHGTAPYQNDMRNNASYFVELMDHNGQVYTHWGKQLAGVLQAALARIGDKISLQWLGTKDATDHPPVSDRQGNAEDPRTATAHRSAWEVQILQRRPYSRVASHAKLDPGQAAPSPADVSANLLQGKLLSHGPAPLKNAKDGKPSYFVQIQNPDGAPRTFWGLDLERALVKSGAQKGDDIVLQNLGRKPVQVDATTRDSAGNVIGMGTVVSHRNAWEISTSRPIARQVEAVAEASPALLASSVAVREAAWWQRQIPFVQTCIEQAPALQGKLEELGPRPDSRDVAWIDKHGDRRIIANDISYGAICDRMPSLKDCQQPVVALEAGTLDGHSQANALKLIRASENYLQGFAQVDGKVRHVVALLPSAGGDNLRGDGTPIPLMAAIPAPDGFAWERIGQLRADRPAPEEDRQAATMHVDLGRESIRVQVHAQPGDALHQRLGLAAAGDHRPDIHEPTGQRQAAHGDHPVRPTGRATKPDTPTYA